MGELVDLIPGAAILAAEAAEEFVPPDDWRSIVALPAAFLFFFVSVYLLVRSNLGTRRGYLVCATSFFGFMLILSLFWTGGAPGTPIATGPQTLPGQPLDYWTPKWEPFAVDSVIADEQYPLVKSYPEGFSQVEPDSDLADLTSTAVDEIRGFLAAPRADVPGPIGESWQASEPEVATAADGTQLVAVTYQAVDSETGEVDPETEPYTGFAFYEPGFVILPSLIMVALSLLGFALHVALLVWDENRERRQQADEPVGDRREERVPARA